MGGTPKTNFLLDTAVALPGTPVTGRFVVDVFSRPFQLTGAYVELTGKEYSHVTFGRGRKKIVLPSWSTHVDIRQTVYGVPKESAREGGGAVLDPGHYEFPFSITLPLDAPPTYGWDAYKCGSRLKYKLRGVLNVPHRSSIRMKRAVTVLPTVSYAQAAATQAQVQSAGTQQVPLMKYMGLSMSKTQYAQVGVQVWPAVVVLGGKMAELYYEEQRQVAAGAHGQAVTGLQLGVAEDDSDDDDDSDEDDAKKKKAISDALAKTEAMGGAYKDNSSDTSSESDDEEEGDESSSASDEKPHAEEKEKSRSERRADRRAQRRERRDERREKSRERRANRRAARSAAREKKEPLVGRVLPPCGGDPATRPLSCAALPPTAGVVYVRVRVTVQNNTTDAIRTFTVALRQLREARVLRLSRTDTVTLSTVTVELDHGCAPGCRIATDVELPLLQDMHYYLNWRERRRGLRKAARRQPQPTLRTGNFSCETFVEVTFPKTSLHKEMGRFPGCVQVVEVVGAPGVPNITVPATYTRTNVSMQ